MDALSGAESAQPPFSLPLVDPPVPTPSPSSEATVPGDVATEKTVAESMPSGQASSHSREEEEEDGPVCRVCHMEADPGRPLYHPCRCSGSIKFVHQDCLLQWLSASRNTQKRCELCGSRFSFTPVYRSDAPARLTLWDMIKGLRDKLAGSLPLLARGIMLAALWLGLLPLLTWVIFEAYFCNSWEEFRREMGLTKGKGEEGADLAKMMLMAGFGGGAVCTAIVIISLIALNVREALLAHLPLRPLLAAMEGRRPRGVRRRRRAEDGQQQQAGQPVDDDRGEEDHGHEENDDSDDDVDDDDDDEGEEEEEDDEGEEDLLDDDDDDILVVNNHGPEGAGMDLGNAGLHLLDGEDDGVPQQLGDPLIDLQQLLGFHVPLGEAVRRWGRFCMYNFGFLTLFQFLPYQLGVQVWAWAQQLHPSPLTSLIEYTKAAGEMLLIGEVDSLWNREVQSVVQTALTEGLLSLHHKKHPGSSGRPPIDLLDRLVFLGLGYCMLLFILILACFSLLLVFALRHPTRVMRSARHLEKAWADFLTFVKLGTLYTIDALVVPQVLGWAIDLATVRLMNATVRDRLAFLEEWPFPSTMLHWLYGFLFIVASSLLSTELRRVLHPDTLAHVLPQPHGAMAPDLFLDLEPLPPFIADADPAQAGNGGGHGGNGGVAQRPMSTHLQQMARSLLIHFYLLAIVIYLPARYGHSCLLVYHMPPLHLRLTSASHSFIDFHFPLELLLFHVAMPIILERFHLRDAVRWLFEKPFVLATRFVGLGDHILDVDYLPRPRPVPTEQHNPSPPPSYRNLRVMWLALLTSYATYFLSSLLLHVPVRVGRLLLAVLGAPSYNDVYNAGIGLLIVWAAGAAVHWLVTYVIAHWPAPAVVIPPPPTPTDADGATAGTPTNQPQQALPPRVFWIMPLAVRLLLKLVQVLILAALWLLAIPLILGLVFEVMLIVPVRVPLNETPFVSPLEAWALGLVFLKIWLRCIFLGVLGADNVWKRRFDRVRANGFRNLDFRWTLQEVVLPVAIVLGDLLFTPHFLVKTTEILVSQPAIRAHVLHVLDEWAVGKAGVTMSGSELIDTGVALAKRTAWLAYLGVKLAVRAHGFAGRALKKLHDRIRDEQYLLGVELKNHHPE